MQKLVSRIGLFSGRNSLLQDCIFSVQMAILSRMYPCKECADHFSEILRYNFIFILSSYFCTSIRSQLHVLVVCYKVMKCNFIICTGTISQRLFYIILNNWMSVGYIFGRTNPVQTGSHAEFSQWLCHVHNTVNRR